MSLTVGLIADDLFPGTTSAARYPPARAMPFALVWSTLASGGPRGLAVCPGATKGGGFDGGRKRTGGGIRQARGRAAPGRRLVPLGTVRQRTAVGDGAGGLQRQR